jgi:hypothetical protein
MAYDMERRAVMGVAFGSPNHGFGVIMGQNTVAEGS